MLKSAVLVISYIYTMMYLVKSKDNTSKIVLTFSTFVLLFFAGIEGMTADMEMTETTPASDSISIETKSDISKPVSSIPAEIVKPDDFIPGIPTPDIPNRPHRPGRPDRPHRPHRPHFRPDYPRYRRRYRYRSFLPTYFYERPVFIDRIIPSNYDDIFNLRNLILVLVYLYLITNVVNKNDSVSQFLVSAIIFLLIFYDRLLNINK